jgi:hypothetical protein
MTKKKSKIVAEWKQDHTAEGDAEWACRQGYIDLEYKIGTRLIKMGKKAKIHIETSDTILDGKFECRPWSDSYECAGDLIKFIEFYEPRSRQVLHITLTSYNIRDNGRAFILDIETDKGRTLVTVR